jgi:hypothetical protein
MDAHLPSEFMNWSGMDDPEVKSGYWLSMWNVS